MMFHVSNNGKTSRCRSCCCCDKIMCRAETHQQQQRGHHNIHRRSSRWTAFRTGKLHWGFHGLLGVLSILTTVAAQRMYSNSKQSHHRLSSAVILFLSQTCCGILVYNASSLLHQVPAFTTIFPGVTAPHKEAFRRTISAMQYLIVRVLAKALWRTQHTRGEWKTLVSYSKIGLLLVFFYPLIPSWRAEWLNGNTWIFVLPMFFGIGGDLYQYIAWSDCVTVSDLLLGQLLGLCLAFGFTLGFRNYIPMPAVYLTAAVLVWKIIQEGYVAINECIVAKNSRS